MRIFSKSALVLAVLLLSVWAIYPPEKNLRLGKDLAGGVSLVYTVDVSGDTRGQDVVARVIEVIKERIDPTNSLEMSIVRQGTDRIEITMPLPSERVKKLKAEFEAELARLGAAAVNTDGLERALAMEPAARKAELERLAASDPVRTAKFAELAIAYDATRAARSEYEAKNKQVAALRAQLAEAEKDPAKVGGPEYVDLLRTGLKAEEANLDALVAAAAEAEIAYGKKMDEARALWVSPSEVRRALSLSDKVVHLNDQTTGKVESLDSPRKQALDRLRKTHPGAEAQLNRVVAAWVNYEQNRRTLDDPDDLVRMLQGAGVLTFRITVDPGTYAEEGRLRQQLRESGLRSRPADEARWYKINRIENWYESVQELRALKADPAGYFAQRRNLVVEEYDGEYYMLCWDRPGLRLTPEEGTWGLSGAYRGQDQLGRPAINFSVDSQGAPKLGVLTEKNIKSPMAVLLDDQVYTAPTLQGRISSQGQITGNFNDTELNYIIRVLAAGSLQAKLSPAPISQTRVGPTLGADNLHASFITGIVAFALVAGFMVVYYFGSGAIAVVALLYNFILVLGIMSLNRAAFTVPGIAGIVLTFGQAVDSNVLIYERMREEFQRGADMRTAIRLGFSRALSPIVDGNISNLIICAVLSFGTQEIRGFAVTLGIGVLTTLFSSLVVSRLIFTVLVERFGWRRTSQLPMAVPLVQRLLSPHVNWMKHRWALLGALVVFLIASAAITVQRGSSLLGTEFRGGTQVELQFKTDPQTKQPVTLTRLQVQQRLSELARAAAPTDPVHVLQEVDVLPVEPRQDGVTSDRFKIRFAHTADERAVLAAITRQFGDVMDSLGALSFAGADAADVRAAPVHPVLAGALGENINRPALRDDVGAYLGGAVIVLDRIEPPTRRESLVARLEEMRQQPEYADTLLRAREVRVIDGDDGAVRAAVVLVRDESASAIGDPDRWEREVGAREWRLVKDALTRTSQPASIESFSPAIARTFVAQGIVSIALSLLLLTIYVFARFGTVRWAVAATLPLFADAIGIVGLIAVAQLLYENPHTNGFARAIGLRPFKFDLPQVAAMLTIVGYSLNDKIIILDRIRENKGRLPYASYAVVNSSINQTLSRTIITAGAHMITTIVLYVFGGEAVRGFAYTFNLGVLLGTYTSIVSTPLVWSRLSDPHLPPETPPGAGSAARLPSKSPNGQAGTVPSAGGGSRRSSA